MFVSFLHVFSLQNGGFFVKFSGFDEIKSYSGGIVYVEMCASDSADNEQITDETDDPDVKTSQTYRRYRLFNVAKV